MLSVNPTLVSVIYCRDLYYSFTLNLTVMYNSVCKYLDVDPAVVFQHIRSEMEQRLEVKMQLSFLLSSLNITLSLSIWLAGLWAPTLCTVTATCSGCQTGWRVATRSLASPAVPGPATWPTNCCSPRPPRSSPAQVNIHRHAHAAL